MSLVGKRNHEGYMDITAYVAIKNFVEDSKMEKEFYKGDIFGTYKNDGSEGNPCVIVSSDKVNTMSNAVCVVYITEKDFAKKTNVSVVAQGEKIAECDRIYCLHKSRIGGYMRTCTGEEIQKIDAAIIEALDLGFCMIGAEEEIEILKDKNKCIAEENAMYLEKYDNAKKERDSLAKEIEILKEKIDTGGTMAADQKEKVSGSYNEIKLQTERDLYKKLYDETLNKLFDSIS